MSTVVICLFLLTHSIGETQPIGDVETKSISKCLDMTWNGGTDLESLVGGSRVQ